MKRKTLLSLLTLGTIVSSQLAFAAPSATPPYGSVDALFNSVTANTVSSGTLTLVGQFTGYAGGSSTKIYNNGITWINLLGPLFPAFLVNGASTGGYLAVWNDGSIFSTGNLALKGALFNPDSGVPLNIQDPDGVKVSGDVQASGDVVSGGTVTGMNGNFAMNLDGTYISGYHLKVQKLGDSSWDKFWYKTIAPGTVADYSGANSSCYDGDVAIACQYYAFKESSDAATASKCSSGTDGTVTDDVVATKYVIEPNWDNPTPGGNCKVRLKNTGSSGSICGVVKTICLKLDGGP